MMNSTIFTTPLKDICAEQNENLKLKCSLNVDATVEWFKNEKKLKTATTRKKKEHFLNIHNMSSADCGKYICRCNSAETFCILTLKNGNSEGQVTKLSYVELEIRLMEARNAETHTSDCLRSLTEDKEKLHKQIEEMKKDIEKYKTEIKDARKEMAHLLKKIDPLKETVSKLNQNIANYETLLKTKDKKLEEERQEHREYVEFQKQIELERKTTWNVMKTVVTACTEKMEIENKRLETANEKAEMEKKEPINTNVKELQEEIRDLKETLESEKTRLENEKTAAINEKTVAVTELNIERSQKNELLKQQQESIPKKEKDCNIS